MDNLNWKPAKPPVKRAVKALIKDTGLTELVARILVQRGVSSIDDAENFLKPKLDDLHNPELMLNMDKAIGRLNKAIRNPVSYTHLTLPTTVIV